jgi:hypothetical protein
MWFWYIMSIIMLWLLLDNYGFTSCCSWLIYFTANKSYKLYSCNSNDYYIYFIFFTESMFFLTLLGVPQNKHNWTILFGSIINELFFLHLQHLNIPFNWHIFEELKSVFWYNIWSLWLLFIIVYYAKFIYLEVVLL